MLFPSFSRSSARTLAAPAAFATLAALAAATTLSLSPAAHAAEPATGLAPRAKIEAAPAYLGPITLQVDATDVQRRILRIEETLPVKAGALKLYHPLWLPGQHGPYGNVSQLAGLTIRTEAGEPLAWRRDTLEPQAFHVTVPAGVQRLQISAQSLTPSAPIGAARVVMTPKMLNVQWQSVLLYPAGHDASAIAFDATLKLPDGWQAGTALRPLGSAGAEGQRYERVSLEHLVDSPVFAGLHFKRVPLDDSGARPVVLNLVGDTDKVIAASEAQIKAHQRLVVQADRLFGARHFAHYDFLLSVSDEMGRIGLEHHQSSENGVGTKYFKDWDKGAGARGLLPHEYVHSWNGKFRRPADLTTPHFNTPMQDSLLWLYEGQTQFWGRVLAVRSGLETLDQGLEGLAQTAAAFESRAGRTWRSLQDTTNEGALAAKGEVKEWRDWQRSADYYDEATLIWLDADSLMREQSKEAKGLEDFARAFFGVQDGQLGPLTYTFGDIVGTLNAVWPHDWAGFLRQRLDAVGPQAKGPMDGLARAGWKLVWKDEPSKVAKADDAARKTIDFVHSLGLRLAPDGKVSDVAWDSPAFKAGLTRATQLLAVQGEKFSDEGLSDALKANRNGSAPIELLLRDGDRFRTVRIDYRGGPRYPALARIDGTVDRLTPLLTAK